MTLKSKTIGCLVGPQYEDLEFWVPYMRMQEEGADVLIIGTKKAEAYKSKSGGLIAHSKFAAHEMTILPSAL